MLLYEHPLSSYAQKIKIALREKGVEFSCQLPGDLATGAEGPLSRANPRGEVPVLVVAEGEEIFESTIILEYVEERWPTPALLPRDPLARARARTIEEICDSQYEAINWGFGEILWFRRAEGALEETLRAEARRQTAIMQDWLADRLGAAEWLGGEAFGWADVAAAPMVNRSVHYGMGPSPGSPLALWHARVSARPSVARTFAEFDAAAAMMHGAAASYLSGERRREYRDHRLDWMIRSGGLEVVVEGMRRGNIRFSWPGPA